jgi:hypothetical protein
MKNVSQQGQGAPTHLHDMSIALSVASNLETVGDI